MQKFLVLFISILSLSSFGSINSAPEKSLIIRFQNLVTADAIKEILNSPEIEGYEVLVPSLNLYKVTFKKPVAQTGHLRLFSTSPFVRYAQPNHVVKLRQMPNDPKFPSQWALSATRTAGDIGVQKAWDLGTGGKDAHGNDIVVAVVDGGVDVSHTDLKNNIWTNPGEIPANGVDDEGNGYIDDVNGWNVYKGSGDLSGDPTDEGFLHGTHVSGIIGAEGDNGVLVSGINWHTHIMAVAGSSGETAMVAKAYGYVLAQKKLWIESHGLKGANVVVTNSSFGVDNGDCSSQEFSAWNDLYTALGEVGILSAVATANVDLNVDKVGDVPSGCSSPYLITVTNTDINDQKFPDAATGLKSIMLGAPGTDILSTVPGNIVQKETGTSMATPHVTGSVALLHSLASSSFADFYAANPSQAALKLKSMILTSVDPVPSLKGVTVTGGRLNVWNAAQKVSNY